MRKKSLTSLESAVLTFTSGTSDEFWEVETDLKRKSLTRAANQGKPLRVLKADVEGNLALGGGDHVRVGKAHLKLQVVLGVVAKTIPSCTFSINLSLCSFILSPGMLTPGPICRVFNWLLWVLRPVEYLKDEFNNNECEIAVKQGQRMDEIMQF